MCIVFMGSKWHMNLEGFFRGLWRIFCVQYFIRDICGRPETGPGMAIKGWRNRGGVGAGGAVICQVKRAIVIEVGRHGFSELHPGCFIGTQWYQYQTNILDYHLKEEYRKRLENFPLSTQTLLKHSVPSCDTRAFPAAVYRSERFISDHLHLEECELDQASQLSEKFPPELHQ